MSKIVDKVKELTEVFTKGRSIREMLKNFWGGKTKAQKRIIISIATLVVAVLNVMFPIPFISWFISALVTGVSIGLILAAVHSIKTHNALAGNIDETNSEKLQQSKVDKDKKNKKDKKLSKKEQAAADLLEQSRREYDALSSEKKKELDEETQKVMSALFNSGSPVSSTSTSSHSKVENKENFEEIEQVSNNSFNDVFKKNS